MSIWKRIQKKYKSSSMGKTEKDKMKKKMRVNRKRRMTVKEKKA